jgi:hypothetical protein
LKNVLYKALGSVSSTAKKKKKEKEKKKKQNYFDSISP